MHRSLFVSAKVVAAAACLAAAITVAGSATASAAPLTDTHANAASSLVYFFGSGSSFQQAAAMAEGEAAQDGYWSCRIVSESTFPGIFGPTYSVTVGCTVF
ncbi:MAG TPA: hypothetical protein VH352_23435 [Pseudonocardiaceae bacterium]|nr:hypothetical protein [Pseudonocardiaceae bacterium]